MSRAIEDLQPYSVTIDRYKGIEARLEGLIRARHKAGLETNSGLQQSKTDLVDMLRLLQRISASEKQKTDKSCVICMEEYDVNDTTRATRALACRHVYHAECINSWLLCKKVCPLCRAPASIVSINRQ
ncbi:probable E3 ubiquitin-protein ligase ZFP1 [Tanacetum coccineum]|uniref:RING-type E3 ubiquitin transferase n=1 Tax=Tanacetum coccineum TaxID=301880 RepID=A0ABQ5CBD1_9ASTR